MDKQIEPIKRLKKHQQDRLELEIGKLKQLAVEIQNNINTLHDDREINQQNKVEYIKSFYRRLKEAAAFRSNVFYELEIETSKFNLRDSEIEEEIDENIDELEQVELESQRLQQELRGVIVKLEKYKFIQDDLRMG
ncbi:MAG: hypothetical protein QG673_1362 [Pseudomonadota bacterium]|nr:hypothetical protein [Pseudomonadota bacterium]